MREHNGEELSDRVHGDTITDVPLDPGAGISRKKFLQNVNNWLFSHPKIDCDVSPEIAITSEASVQGKWAMRTAVITEQVDTENMKSRIIGYYTDKYINVNGEWKVSSLKLTPQYEFKT